MIKIFYLKYKNVNLNPKYQNGELTAQECLKLFLDHFDVSQHRDGIVFMNEYINFTMNKIEI
jgi:hypothetical protein